MHTYTNTHTQTHTHKRLGTLCSNRSARKVRLQQQHLPEQSQVVCDRGLHLAVVDLLPALHDQRMPGLLQYLFIG